MEGVHIDKISERKIYSLLYNTISNETRAKKKKRDGTKSLDHRIEFFVTDSMKQTEDFEIKTLSRDSEAFPKFQSYFSSIHVSRILWSWIASCFELLRFDGRRRGGRGMKKRGKRNAPFPYAQRPLPELVTIDISYLVSRIP